MPLSTRSFSQWVEFVRNVMSLPYLGRLWPPSEAVSAGFGAGTAKKIGLKNERAPLGEDLMERSRANSATDGIGRVIVQNGTTQFEIDVPIRANAEQENYLRGVDQSTDIYDPNARIRGARPRIA